MLFPAMVRLFYKTKSSIELYGRNTTDHLILYFETLLGSLRLEWGRIANLFNIYDIMKFIQTPVGSCFLRGHDCVILFQFFSF